MPTVARSRLRILLSRATGFYFSGSLTTIGAADGTTIIDTKVIRYNTSLFPDKWVRILSGTEIGVDRRIVSMAAATGTITVTPAFATQIASGVTYEILEYDPDYYHDALQDAGLAVPLYLPIRNETLVVDNLISNFDFETGTFTDWVSINAPTLVADTSYFVHGAQAANIQGTAAVRGIEQNLLTVANGFGRIDQAVGKTLHVRGWLRATDALNARLRVTFDGTTYTNGPYHSGDDDWEGPSIHLIDVAIPANLSEMTVSIEKETAITIRADMVVAWVDSISRYTMPTSLYPNGPSIVEQQTDSARPNGDYWPLRYRNRPIAGRILRLTGMGRLTVPTTDTGTVELDENEATLLIAQAAEFLYRRLTSIGPGDKAEHRQHQLEWQGRAERLKEQIGVGMKPMGANYREGWGVLNDSGTQYLILENR